MSYRFEFELTFTRMDGSPVGDNDALAEDLERVMEELADLKVIDPFMVADLGAGKATIAFASGEDDHEDDLQALALASGTLRMAVHDCGHGTPGWEDIIVKFRGARPVEDPDLVDA